MRPLERIALLRAEEQMETAARQREPVRGPGARRGRCECGQPAADKEKGCDECVRRNAAIHQAERAEAAVESRRTGERGKRGRERAKARAVRVEALLAALDAAYLGLTAAEVSQRMGMAMNTAAQALSRLVVAGKARRVGPGRYARVRP